MANINEEARIPVYINDEQAKSALKNLTSEAEKWRKKMYEAMSGGDLKGMKEAENELKKVNGQMNSIKREAFDVNKVLQDISNASTKDLRKAMQAVNREMEGLNRNSKEYKYLMGKRNQIKEEFAKINGPIKEQAGLLGNIKEMLPIMGWAAMGAAAVAAFKKVVASTDELGTKWEAQMNGMKMASDEFFRTLATGDWSNFMTRMREAVNLGKEYVETLDDMEEKSRALRIIEANARAKELELEDKLRNKTLSKDERIKAGQERIQLEEDLAKKREQLAQQAYDAELKISLAESRLTKEQLETMMADFDSVDKQQAKKYLEAKKRYDDLKQSEAGFREAQGRGIAMANPFTNQLEETKKELDTFPDSVKNYAIAVSGAGKTTDEQLNKTVEMWVKLKEAQNSAVENTKRVRVQVNSLLAGENGNDKKSDDKLLDDTRKADITDEETDSDMNWVYGSLKAEAEAYAEKKRSQDEWTAYLDKKVQEQIDIKNRELEVDKEIAAAQQELKAVRIDAIGQIAGALADMFEKGSAAQIAFLAIEKASAIAQIIFQTGIANAKAVAASPLTFGQPWVSINTVSAGASIAGIVAQTIQQASNYYDGGYTAPGSKHQPAGIVHAGEYVIPQEGVNNAQLKPLINLIEIARQNGSLARLDLRPVVATSGSFASGGSVGSSQSAASNTPSIISPAFDTETANRLITALEKFEKKELVVYTELIKKDLDTLENIEKNRGL